MLPSYQICAVLLDFDGTLTEPGALDFPAIKRSMGCPLETPLLEYIEALEDPGRRESALATLEGFELQAAAASRPNPGAEELVSWIRAQHLPIGILTRNLRVSVRRALENFPQLREADFDLIISRDDPISPKPSGDGIAWAARHWGIDPETILVVGDFILDSQAGAAAGALTALLDTGRDPVVGEAACHFRVRRLADLAPIIRQGLALPRGKLPNDLLEALLKEFAIEDPSVLVGAGVGEDIAALDIAGGEVLILKSDPITFVADAIGRYAVSVNANDIATAGADPRWFLVTLLLPPGVTPSRIRSIMGELADRCRREGVALCGGHTEITDAVTRAVVIGMMAGTVRAADLIEKRRMKAGDRVLLTKAAAVEGTAILAREFEDRLLQMGVSARDIEEGKGFLDQISIVPEARLAARDRLATALHDVTEGGVATALEELSAAGGHALSVDMDRIPVLGPTRKFCAALELDPLGLIGSGALLICCRKAHCDRLVARLRGAGIAVSLIGKVLGPGSGVHGFSCGQPSPWPHVAADELTRVS
jgi:hydrogenase maturation factor/phosphoglycolate phosphatase-like HAD superfamily hydrolase